MKKLTIILLLITLSLLLSHCNSLFDLDEKMSGTYEVKEINGKKAEEIGPTYRCYPKMIKLSHFGDSDYRGTVELDSLGVKQIQNYAAGLANHRQFFISTMNELGPVEEIVFGDLQFSDQTLTGYFCPTGPLIDTTPSFFVASKK
jgi:hypothetical protein